MRARAKDERSPAAKRLAPHFAHCLVCRARGEEPNACGTAARPRSRRDRNDLEGRGRGTIGSTTSTATSDASRSLGCAGALRSAERGAATRPDRQQGPAPRSPPTTRDWMIPRRAARSPSELRGQQPRADLRRDQLESEQPSRERPICSRRAPASAPAAAASQRDRQRLHKRHLAEAPTSAPLRRLPARSTSAVARRAPFCAARRATGRTADLVAPGPRGSAAQRSSPSRPSTLIPGRERARPPCRSIARLGRAMYSSWSGGSALTAPHLLFHARRNAALRRPQHYLRSTSASVVDEALDFVVSTTGPLRICDPLLGEGNEPDVPADARSSRDGELVPTRITAGVRPLVTNATRGLVPFAYPDEPPRRRSIRVRDEHAEHERRAP